MRKHLKQTKIQKLQASQERRQVASVSAAVAEVTQNAEAPGKYTPDSFVNFMFNLGIGADNPTSFGTYGFNPITRQRVLLEWIHRGSWVGGQAVDIVADDMTRAGVDLIGEISPASISKIQLSAVKMGIWPSINKVIKWARLYGGALGIILIDGQDMSTPLRLDKLKPGQFKGLHALDRWMVEPSFNDLVSDFGPDLGLPKYYKISPFAPALVGKKVHHSRCIRMVGIEAPVWQSVMENLWGVSVLERLYDRMTSYDSASTGASQLVYKSYLRTYKVEGLRDIIAAGGEALEGFMKYMDMMRRFQSIEGMTLLDKTDEFSAHTNNSLTGMSEIMSQFGSQISGCLQIPMVRFFGQSPQGFSSGEMDLRSYYDTIAQNQELRLKAHVTTIYTALAISEGIEMPADFGVSFRPLWQLSDGEKSVIANKNVETVSIASEAGLISRGTALKELRQQSRVTSMFSNVGNSIEEEAKLEEELIRKQQRLQLIWGQNDEPVLNEEEPGEKLGTSKVDISGRSDLNRPSISPGNGNRFVPGRRVVSERGRFNAKHISHMGVGFGSRELRKANTSGKIGIPETALKMEKIKTTLDSWSNTSSTISKSGGLVAAGVMFFSGSELLMIKRSSSEADYQGYWTIPGGHIEVGEAPEEAARREVFEEIGVKFVGPLKPISILNKYVTYVAEVSKSDFRIILNEESSGYSWENVEGKDICELPSPLHPAFSLTIKSIFEITHD